MQLAVAESSCRTVAEFNFGYKPKSAVVRPVKSRSIQDLGIPNDTVNFRFHDLIEVQVQIGREREVLEKVRRPSEVYYYGDVYSAAQIRRMFPRQQHLLRQMRHHGARYALRTLFSEWHILPPDVHVVCPRTRRVRRLKS